MKSIIFKAIKLLSPSLFRIGPKKRDGIQQHRGLNANTVKEVAPSFRIGPNCRWICGHLEYGGSRGSSGTNSEDLSYAAFLIGLEPFPCGLGCSFMAWPPFHRGPLIKEIKGVDSKPQQEHLAHQIPVFLGCKRSAGDGVR